MTVTLYRAKMSVLFELTREGWDVVGSVDGTKIFNVSHIRYDGKTLVLVSYNRRTGETSTAVLTNREFEYFDCV